MLHTGGLATANKDGLDYVVSRKADLVKASGYRVRPREVEECLLALLGLVAAAVIGVPDAIRGEAIKAFVTRREGATITPRDVMNHCRRKLPRYMWPLEIVIVDALPLNAHRKVVKAALRGEMEASALGGGSGE